MINALFSSKVRRKILKECLTNPENKYYLRELASLLFVSVGSLHKELNKLEKEGILRSEYVGNLRLIRANKDYPLYKEIKQIIFRTK